jgi:hypothetical protein
MDIQRLDEDNLVVGEYFFCRYRETGKFRRMHVHRHGVIELSWRIPGGVGGETPETGILVEWEGLSGVRRCARAFWDGGEVWRARLSPDEAGDWKWRAIGPAGSEAIEPAQGRFTCVPYVGDHPFYRHGPARVTATGRHLEYADGTPFFWLGDTAWNGVLRGDDGLWARYLGVRAAQRFSVVQFVCTDWRGDAEDPAGERSCTAENPLHVNPAFFQRLDRRVAMINEHGLLAAPVVLWALLPTDPGRRLSEMDATRLAKYVVARYDAYHVCWLIGGDAPYQQIGVERWKRIGREALRFGHDRLATLHPCGQNWVGEEFRDESWYDLIGYQSGHGDAESHLTWLVKGPPATHWNRSPIKPVINLEPNYETARAYHSGQVFSDVHVRRAAWWSLLVSPMAGLTYGHDAVWNWNFETGPSEGHGRLHDGAVPPWPTGLETEGVRSMTVLRGIVERLNWTALTPDPAALADQPGDQDVAAFQAAARDDAGTIVVYAPCGGAVRFSAPPPEPVRLVDPRTGIAVRCSGTAKIALPDRRDWLIVAGPGWRDSA